VIETFLLEPDLFDTYIAIDPRTVLRPKPDDCCVFRSCGSVKCPPIQANAGCCGTRGS
jgi:hypothetical protein